MAGLKVGLAANVKLDDFDHSIFGTMKGRVSYVSADSLVEEAKTGPVVYYRILVAIDEKNFQSKDGKKVEVRPGMTAVVDIKTGGRTILSYLIKPIHKTLGNSLGER
jgi:adhesin transport system membrane fusion protein